MNSKAKYEDILEKVGTNIRFLRKKKSMTIKELALKSGINPNYLADIERGKRNPSVKSLQKIASGLKVKIYRFFN